MINIADIVAIFWLVFKCLNKINTNSKLKINLYPWLAKRLTNITEGVIVIKILIKFSSISFIKFDIFDL